MADVPVEFENLLTQMSSEEFDELVSRTRPAVDSRDPRVRAAVAMRQHRGVDRRGAGARIDRDNPAASSKEQAAEALRSVMGHHRVTIEGED